MHAVALRGGGVGMRFRTYTSLGPVTANSMILVSSVYGPHASSLRTDRAPLPVPRGPVRLSPRHVLTAILSVAVQGGSWHG